MKPLFLIFMLAALSVSAQTPDRIKFYYDGAGNQIERSLCINCATEKALSKLATEIEDVEKVDLLKFSESDVISYYPNPVKEELFLKWDLINDNVVKTIEIYAMSGQLIKSFKNLEREVSKVISFQDFPIGTYSVILFYAGGEQKPITIIKQ